MKVTKRAELNDLSAWSNIQLNLSGQKSGEKGLRRQPRQVELIQSKMEEGAISNQKCVPSRKTTSRNTNNFLLTWTLNLDPTILPTSENLAIKKRKSRAKKYVGAPSPPTEIKQIYYKLKDSSNLYITIKQSGKTNMSPPNRAQQPETPSTNYALIIKLLCPFTTQQNLGGKLRTLYFSNLHKQSTRPKSLTEPNIPTWISIWVSLHQSFGLGRHLKHHHTHHLNTIQFPVYLSIQVLNLGLHQDLHLGVNLGLNLGLHTVFHLSPS